jgi:phage shock protein E
VTGPLRGWCRFRFQRKMLALAIAGRLPMTRSVLRSALFLLLLSLPLFAWPGEAHWIDVRTAEEYASGHVTQAVNIPYEEITERIGEVTTDKDALIYVYCRSGRRSGIAREALAEAGFSNVVNVGGLEDALKKAAQLSPRQ